MPTDTARKLQECNDLVRRIKNHGYELPEMDSCSNCVRRNITCVSSPNDSRRCADSNGRRIAWIAKRKKPFQSYFVCGSRNASSEPVVKICSGEV
ncbi:hypothetical protein GMDG_09030 [Pseudogymnoascus destructans 20631-21]|uniref:Uncharacterized protein n=1 Tax=Pseudogymnoascus destructans (strain ATCC MYA-4855 / 20631-21) TaxID=658429 RepID=L8FX68_PSED2|nr:hypothetical protein GMDG_09030 [Pseudogymnoascus destructans 20631-21]